MWREQARSNSKLKAVTSRPVMGLIFSEFLIKLKVG